VICGCFPPGRLYTRPRALDDISLKLPTAYNRHVLQSVGSACGYATARRREIARKAAEARWKHKCILSRSILLQRDAAEIPFSVLRAIKDEIRLATMSYRATSRSSHDRGRGSSCSRHCRARGFWCSTMACSKC
jgi:hypothetical protein